MNLLAAEITAVTGKDPGEHFQALTALSSARPYYTCIDAAARRREKSETIKLSPETIKKNHHGRCAHHRQTHAPPATTPPSAV